MAEGGLPEPELSRDKQKRIIHDLEAFCIPNTKPGDTFYLISQRWCEELVLYFSQDEDTNVNRPSAIDNSDLVCEGASLDFVTGPQLRYGLLESDCTFLPEAVWNKLHAWYGGGPAFARKVINSSLLGMAVEVYPLQLHLHLMPKNEESIVKISIRGTIGDLHHRARDIFNLFSEQVEIWNYYGKRKCGLLNSMHTALEDAYIQMDQDILVEVVGSIKKHRRATKKTTTIVVGGGLTTSKGLSLKGSYGGLIGLGNIGTIKGRRLATKKTTTFAVGRGLSTSKCLSLKGSSGGLIGLKNLGNTCFMNSAIQCLVHTPQFARYFQVDYQKEINRTSPSPMMGELALAFGELLRKLLAPSQNPVDPRSFKEKLVKFASQFRGNNQHDSQELLEILLDGLHKDLNRVKETPYMKLSDADGRSDEEIADEYWGNHVARNDSIVVDVCQGQYKSTLVCPVCSRFSVSFDPFMHLSLPLPSTIYRTMTVTVFAYDRSKFRNTCTVTVPKRGCVRDLTQSIIYACSLEDNENLLLAKVQDHRIIPFFNDPLLVLSYIKDDDCLVAYKIPNVVKNAKYLELCHYLKQKSTGSSHRKVGWKLFGTPLVFPIICDKSIKGGDIQSRVRSMLSSMLRSEISGHADVSECETSFEKKLPLTLLDEEKVLIDISVEDDKEIKLSSESMSIPVGLEWSDELLESYDIQSLENLPEVNKYGCTMKKGRKEPMTLYSCLEAFLREESLVTDDMWNCPQCKEKRQASMKFDIWRLPEVLVIHLKRFSYEESVAHKLKTFVNFPLYDLDLTKYVVNNKNPRREVYELFALTNHYGSMARGHYTAHVKLLEENRWYNFDDSQVTPLDEDKVQSAAAYVLFYKRVDSKDASGDNGGVPSTGPNVSSWR